MTTLSNEALAKEVLPCPFCGEQPRSYWQGDSSEAGDDGYWAIEHCDAFVHRDDEAEAITAWNTRTPPVREDVLEEAARTAEKVAEGRRNWQRGNYGNRTGIDEASGALMVAAAIRALTTPPEPDTSPTIGEEGAAVTDQGNLNEGSEHALDMAGFDDRKQVPTTSDRLRRPVPATPENSELVTQAECYAECEALLREHDVEPTLYVLGEDVGAPTHYPVGIINAMVAFGNNLLARHRIEATRKAQATPAGEVGELQATVSRLEAENASLRRQLREHAPYSTEEIEVFQQAIECGVFTCEDMLTGSRDEKIERARAALEPTTKYGRGSTGPENGEG